MRPAYSQAICLPSNPSGGCAVGYGRCGVSKTHHSDRCLKTQIVCVGLSSCTRASALSRAESGQVGRKPSLSHKSGDTLSRSRLFVWDRTGVVFPKLRRQKLRTQRPGRPKGLRANQLSSVDRPFLSSRLVTRLHRTDARWHRPYVYQVAPPLVSKHSQIGLITKPRHTQRTATQA